LSAQPRSIAAAGLVSRVHGSFVPGHLCRVGFGFLKKFTSIKATPAEPAAAVE